MTTTLTIAVAQLNPTVGAIDANVDKLLDARASARGADLIVAPELYVCGYPPEDLMLKPAFQRACADGVDRLASATADGGPAILVGAPWRPDADQTNRNPELDNPATGLSADALYNAALLLDEGRVVSARAKHSLPNYGVFDEKRLFTPGPIPGPMACRGVRIGVPICEDLWIPDVAEALVETGAELLIVPNGSPFELGKADLRSQIALARIAETELPVLYVNQVGGQDELVFDGGSFALNADNALAAQAPWFAETTPIWTARNGAEGWAFDAASTPADESELALIYGAMVLGLRDYVSKNGFPGVVLGLSGGIDSALSAAVAVDALGPDAVRCVMMPSRYTAPESLEDAAACAQALGAAYETIPITAAMTAFDAMLKQSFQGAPKGVTAENIQSRARGVTLMALSNATGSMVLTTGNKSEMSVGYATLYGDMCGGYSVLKDVYKTTVFALSRWRNENRPSGALGPAVEVIPERIITKPPSAELRPDQKDEDSLPPYDRLDAMLRALIEADEDAPSLIAQGFDPDEAARVWRLLERAEYKRRQAPPGVKITSRTLSRDRRYPITNGFTDWTPRSSASRT